MGGPILFAAVATLALASAHDPPPSAPDLSRAVLDELNVARTRPHDYARTLRAYRARFDGYLCRDPDGYGPGRMTHEGTAAVDEAIAWMDRQRPLPPLSDRSGLARAAADHAADQGDTGGFGHRGSDGATLGVRLTRAGVVATMSAEVVSYGEDTAEGVVRQLIVDDGLRSRSHRADVLDPRLTTAGVGCGPHRTWGAMCVVDLAR